MPSDGIIILNKPQAMTSHDAVSFVRRLLGMKRVGHSGTLDPMATGVLPIFVGKATRLIEFATEGEKKTYRCDMRLGFESDTQDVWGEVIATNVSLPSEQEITRVLQSFVGTSTQRTPLYSAVKYKGRKLYEYARAGEEPPEEALKEREITIDSLVIHEIDAAGGEVSFTLCCSRGSYVRTICSDAGKLLGCGAVMSGLTRLASGGFTIARSHAPEALMALAEAGAPLPLLPMDACITGLPQAALTTADAARFMNGMRVRAELSVLGGKCPPELQPQAASATPSRGGTTDYRPPIGAGPRNPRGESSVTVADTTHAQDSSSAPGQDEFDNRFVRVYSGAQFLGIAQQEGDTLKPYKVIATE